MLARDNRIGTKHQKQQQQHFDQQQRQQQISLSIRFFYFFCLLSLSSLSSCDCFQLSSSSSKVTAVKVPLSFEQKQRSHNHRHFQNRRPFSFLAIASSRVSGFSGQSDSYEADNSNNNSKYNSNSQVNNFNSNNNSDKKKGIEPQAQKSSSSSSKRTTMSSYTAGGGERNTPESKPLLGTTSASSSATPPSSTRGRRVVATADDPLTSNAHGNKGTPSPTAAQSLLFQPLGGGGSASNIMMNSKSKPMVTMQQIQQAAASINGNMVNMKQGGGMVAGQLIGVPPTAAVNPKRVAKISRPRKAIAEFRKKGRTSRQFWQGRIGVHVQVDEVMIEQLSNKIAEKLPGWDVTDYYDAIRLHQTEPPYIGHEQWVDWPMSENEEDDGDNSLRGGGADNVDWNASVPEIFIFSFGAVVFWNFPSAEFEDKWFKENIMDIFPDCFGENHTVEEMEAARDEMAFVFGEAFKLKRDVATLTTRETGEKLAVSFALAKSSLLTVYEERVQRTIQRNSHIPDELSKNGQLHMSRQDISKEVGKMLIVKHGINLDQSLIDTPEEFWEDDRFESTYENTLKYFEITKRLTLVNNRLNMMGELHQILIEANQNHHAVILEWIIIILIVVEVLLDLLHLGFY